MPTARHPIIAAAVLASVLAAANTMAQAPWREGFETAGPPTWREAGADAQYRIVNHQRLQQDAHTGTGCEWLRIEGDGGSYVYLAHDVGRPTVIDDLALSIWLRADRPGLQIAARIVLPRSVDQRTGRPLTALVAGSRYSDIGRWQQLRLDGIPRLLEREVHLLRTQLGPQVDEREAYVDAVFVNVYGGPGTTNVWIDDLEAVGRVARQRDDTPSRGGSFDGATASWAPRGLVRLPPVDRAQPSSPQHTVKLSNSFLTIDGRPFFPRVIQHRGEPLDLLKRMGFNAVWLPRAPEPEMIEEASRLGLWLVCPPPVPPASQPAVASQPATPEIGPQYDCVLAWDLGGNLGPAELESTQRWADRVRAADRRCSRPLVCHPRSELRSYSRSADLLLVDRRPLGTSLELSAYANWARRQPLLASLGTPVWTAIQTQPNEALRQQIALLSPGRAPPLTVAPEQIRLLCYAAVAAGSRGMVFASDSPLDATDVATRQRAAALEQMNLELDLLEPWAAAGGSSATADSSIPEVRATVLSTARAHLLLPLWSSRGAQCVPAQSAANGLTLVVPGVPEASSAYEVTLGGLNPLRHKRVAGGVSVTLDEFGVASQVLMAQDPLVIAAVHHRATQWGRRTAELARHLAVYKFNSVQSLAAQMPSHGTTGPTSSGLTAARRELQSCDAQLAAGNLPAAAVAAQRAERALRIVERAHWEAAQRDLASMVTSPAALSFETLPAHWQLIDRLRGARFTQNLIAGGDFEDIETMRRAGWQFFYRPAPGSQGEANLAEPAAHNGRLGLRLAVASLDPKNPPAAIEAPPVLFTSPAVQAAAGQIVCIHGWVRAPRPITASADGLMIIDSISGEALADRIGQTKDWRQFAMYRVAPQAGPVSVTFALSGVGEAWLDDVEIELIADR
ncbi:MAG: hypothetical protein ABFC96_00475 [Thermoguttaceae bacterium]